MGKSRICITGELMRKQKYYLLILLTLCSCSVNYLEISQENINSDEFQTNSETSSHTIPKPETTPKAKLETQKWTHLIYMAADNSLDSQSLNDLNEIEASQSLQENGMNCLVLIDRSKDNGDWSDTRLYKVQNTPGVNSAHISSQQIDCPSLGLSTKQITELNMADPITLERFVCFAIENYPAEKYSLTIWGHGTGWRSSENNFTSEIIPFKAVAVDETSAAYMRISELAQALTNVRKNTRIKLEVLGFDTCFGSLLEVAYPLQDCANYLVGSTGPIKDTGWNYTELFNKFYESNLEALDFCKAIQEQFSKSYSNIENATISILDLKFTREVQFQFNAWAQEQANFLESISNIQDRNCNINTIRNLLLNEIDAFYFPSALSDYYVDILSLIMTISELTNIYPTTYFLNLIDALVVSTWSKKYEKQNKQIGIYINGINSNKVFDTTHSKEYTIGSGAVVNQFVLDSPGWCVHQDKTQTSFLNLIFYR